jgi:hypothetical protein
MQFLLAFYCIYLYNYDFNFIQYKIKIVQINTKKNNKRQLIANNPESKR